MKRCSKPSSLFSIFLLSLQLLIISNANHDTITTMQMIRDGDTLVSSMQKFELGFFSPVGSSGNRYVGIWYKNVTVMTVVWVANRDTPLRNTTSGVLTVNSRGQLIILDDQRNNNNTTLWSTNTTSSVFLNPVAQLLDSGNLVIRDDADNYLWQSFDYPTDTSLPGMGYGVNLVTGHQIQLTSWKSESDPAIGDFTVGLEITGYPQLVLKKGDALLYREGPWDGQTFSGIPKSNSVIETLIMNSSVVYYNNKSIPPMTMLTLSPSGIGRVVSWNVEAHDWLLLKKFPAELCDFYATCGAHGSCNTANIPVCGCLQRFVPRDNERWAEKSDWSGGCVRRTPLNCSTDVFLNYTGIKMPDARHTWYNESSTLQECEAMCLRNCSCTAFSNLNISGGGSGCLLWFGDLIDIKQLSWVTQEMIHIRMAVSEKVNITAKSKRRKQETFIISYLLPVVIIILIALSLILFYHKRKKITRQCMRIRGGVSSSNNQSHNKDLELPLFDLHTLTKATNNFSIDNKLGEGGFGPVYKGLLEKGQEIAVKRLSSTSHQGVHEFENEVICIAKLQHRNLVKLLGYCIQGEENMLVYEYMSNKSLELILFDPGKSTLLDWPKRFNIINGVARGIMYLHQDSRLRIIHRDLKASNILLDSEMNPKISDFGLARSFGGNETGANTRRVVGTYGYMSPEYAVNGRFSVKSDVFSFGVLVLEIVSGKSNRSFSHKDHSFNLLGHAWMLYREGQSSELVGFNLDNPSYLSEALRSIHVGLLCVQQHCEDRPNMSSVVMMLGNNGVLPHSKHPGFFTGRDIIPNEETSTDPNTNISTNEMSITLMEPR